MSRFYLFALSLMFCLGLGVLLSCSGDDDDSNGSGDDAEDDDGDDDDDDDSASGETWIDPTSGLTWQVTPSSEYMNWEDASTYCENLSLEGAGWHLPNISELRSLVRGCEATVTGGACGVTDSCLEYSCSDESCSSCEYGSGPTNGICYGPSELPLECEWFWSSSPMEENPFDEPFVWVIHFGDASLVHFSPDSVAVATRCVR
mgnify:CR=1 FL=1